MKPINLIVAALFTLLTACGSGEGGGVRKTNGGAEMPAVTQYQDTVADAQTGRPIANAQVVITNSPAGTPATVYDSAGNVTAAPIVTDKDGWFAVYLKEGTYNITVASGSVSKIYQGVVVGPSGTYGTVSGAVAGLSGSPTKTISWAKIGRVVTVSIPEITGTGTGSNLEFATPLPASVRPAAYVVQPAVTIGNNQSGIGNVQITSDGVVRIFQTTMTGSQAIPPINVSYLVD